jgi:hypothetical protein
LLGCQWIRLKPPFMISAMPVGVLMVPGVFALGLLFGAGR